MRLGAGVVCPARGIIKRKNAANLILEINILAVTLREYQSGFNEMLDNRARVTYYPKQRVRAIVTTFE